jgi:hypothetical protein
LPPPRRLPVSVAPNIGDRVVAAGTVLAFDRVRAVELVARWWNGQRDRLARRDIWLTSDGHRWHVRARHGDAAGREVRYDFGREYEARAMVDRLIAAAPGRWKDITKLVRKPAARPPE